MNIYIYIYDWIHSHRALLPQETEIPGQGTDRGSVLVVYMMKQSRGSLGVLGGDALHRKESDAPIESFLLVFRACAGSIVREAVRVIFVFPVIFRERCHRRIEASTYAYIYIHFHIIYMHISKWAEMMRCFWLSHASFLFLIWYCELHYSYYFEHISCVHFEDFLCAGSCSCYAQDLFSLTELCS